MLIIYNKEKQNIDKAIKNNYLSAKNFVDIPKHCWYKEHPKTSHKLSKKSKRQVEKVDSTGYLYSDTKLVKIF